MIQFVWGLGSIDLNMPTTHPPLENVDVQRATSNDSCANKKLHLFGALNFATNCGLPSTTKKWAMETNYPTEFLVLVMDRVITKLH